MNLAKIPLKRQLIQPSLSLSLGTLPHPLWWFSLLPTSNPLGCSMISRISDRLWSSCNESGGEASLDLIRNSCMANEGGILARNRWPKIAQIGILIFSSLLEIFHLFNPFLNAHFLSLHTAAKYGHIAGCNSFIKWIIWQIKCLWVSWPSNRKRCISRHTYKELPKAKEYKTLGRSQVVTTTVVIFIVLPSVLTWLPLHMTRS